MARVLPSIFATATAGGQISGGTMLSLTWPADVVEGQFAIIVGGKYDDDGSHFNAPGFTYYTERGTTSGSDQTRYILGRICDGTESGSFSVSCSSADTEDNTAILAVLDDVDLENPFGAVLSHDHISDDADYDQGTPQVTSQPSITTEVDNCLILSTQSMVGLLPAGDHTSPPSGYTAVANVQENGSVDHSLFMQSKALPTAGEETPGLPTWDISGTTGDVTYWTIAIRGRDDELTRTPFAALEDPLIIATTKQAYASLDNNPDGSLFTLPTGRQAGDLLLFVAGIRDDQDYIASEDFDGSSGDPGGGAFSAGQASDDSRISLGWINVTESTPDQITVEVSGSLPHPASVICYLLRGAGRYPYPYVWTTTEWGNQTTNYDDQTRNNGLDVGEAPVDHALFFQAVAITHDVYTEGNATPETGYTITDIESGSASGMAMIVWAKDDAVSQGDSNGIDPMLLNLDSEGAADTTYIAFYIMPEMFAADSGGDLTVLGGEHSEHDGLMSYLVSQGATSREVVGALNELNGTEGIGFREAFNTYFGLS